MEVLEIHPSETLKKIRGGAAESSRPVATAVPRPPVERWRFDEEARQAELEHVAVLGYN